MFPTFMKIFLLQNVVRADIFTNSLAVFPKNAASPNEIVGDPQIVDFSLLAPRVGLEPTTNALTGRRATIAPPRNMIILLYFLNIFN